MHNLQKLFYFARGAFYTALLRLHGAKVGRRLRVEAGVRFRYALHRGITIGNDVYISQNCCFDTPPGITLSIGDFVSFNIGVFIGGNNAIAIGNNVLVGEYTSIRDSTHGMALCDVPINRQPMHSAPVHIADNVWIGRGVCILPGVNIAEGAVIGANAVVTHDAQANGIYAGIPARFLRMRNVP